MKTILAATMVALILAASGAAASPAPPSVDAPEAIAPAAGSIFAELTDLGYDLGKFKPDYAGRFPYR